MKAGDSCGCKHRSSEFYLQELYRDLFRIYLGKVLRDMSINVKLLKQICEVPGAPGREQLVRELVMKQQLVRELVMKQVKGHVDSIDIDNMGNITVVKKGKKSDRKVMIAAHMDEIGFMVNHIDEKGFLRFVPLGGFDPKTLTAQRVIVHGKKDLIGVMGCKPNGMQAYSRNERIRA